MSDSAERAPPHHHPAAPDPGPHTLHGLVPAAALLDGTWYVVIDGTDDYQPAPEPLATTLTQADAALTAADRHLAQAQSQP